MFQKKKKKKPLLYCSLRQPTVLSQLVNYIVSERIIPSTPSISHTNNNHTNSNHNNGVKRTNTSGSTENHNYKTSKDEGKNKKANNNNNNHSADQHVYIACEILAAGVPALMDGLVYAHPELLTVLWAILDQQCKLTPRQLAGFCKVNGILFQRRTGDMVHFIESHKDIVAKWLHHIFGYHGGGVPYLSDLLIALVQADSLPEGSGIGQVNR